MTYDIAAAFAAHAAQTRYENLPPAALRAAKTFLLDTLGVGLAGSSGANVRLRPGPVLGAGRGIDRLARRVADVGRLGRHRECLSDPLPGIRLRA
jgi:hypothetical protein